MRSIYSDPVLQIPKDPAKPWLIYYRYNGTPVRKKYGLNYIKDFEERKTEAAVIIASLKSKLKSGWNPFVEDLTFNSGSDMTIVEALDYGMEKRTPNISKNTVDHYNLTIKYAKTAIKSLNLDSLPIAETKRVHIKTIMEKIQKQRKWSNKAYNKNLGYLRAIIGELIEWNIIEFNPASKIKSLKTPVSIANIPATDDQSQKIKNHLKSKWYNFYIFNSIIFHTGIRPEEILQIKIEMVNLDKREIILPPEITKTGIYRIVPINDYLLKDLQVMELQNYPGSFYVFGTARGKKRNVGVKKETDFLPAPENLHSDTATKLWRKLVKTELGISVNMYSEKHRGANKKILAGVDLDALKELYGHTSKLTTLTYAKVVKEVNRKQIIEKSPDF